MTFTGYIIFTGYALKRNFGEGLIPLVLGLLSVALLCWDNYIVPWYEKKYEGKEEEVSSGPIMKILNWTLRIIGLGIVLGVFGWLIYDIFFEGEDVKARILKKIKSIFNFQFILGQKMKTYKRLKILLVWLDCFSIH